MNPTKLRCKMRVSSVVHNKNTDGSTESEELTLSAVTADTPENKQWSKWTPNASFKMTINNPSAIGLISKGHEFYVDLIPV